MCKNNVKKVSKKQQKETKKAALKRAESSVLYLIDIVENTELSKYIYREDYVGLKRIRDAILKIEEKEGGKK